MALRILVLKTETLSIFLRRTGSNLFHSMIVDGKNQGFKKAVVCMQKENVYRVSRSVQRSYSRNQIKRY